MSRPTAKKRLRKTRAGQSDTSSGLPRDSVVESPRQLPARWSAGQNALRAVQVAFDVNEQVLEAVRTAAFKANLSNSDQIRLLLQLPVAQQIKRPRLTITLSDADYSLLGSRFSLPEHDRLGIKERAAQVLLNFAEAHRESTPKQTSSRPRTTALSGKKAP